MKLMNWARGMSQIFAWVLMSKWKWGIWTKGEGMLIKLLINMNDVLLASADMGGWVKCFFAICTPCVYDNPICDVRLWLFAELMDIWCELQRILRIIRSCCAKWKHFMGVVWVSCMYMILQTYSAVPNESPENLPSIRSQLVECPWVIVASTPDALNMY